MLSRKQQKRGKAKAIFSREFQEKRGNRKIETKERQRGTNEDQREKDTLATDTKRRKKNRRQKHR